MGSPYPRRAACPTRSLRFTLAFGGNDQEALREVYDEDVQLYGPLTWPPRGRQALLG